MGLFPVLGDEAYYFYWGMHPSAGYYDLPPMIGWWLVPFVKISLATAWLRLPNLISLTLIGFSIYEWLKFGVDKPRAKLIAASFVLLPLPFMAVLMFPDIPLVLFSYFSAYLFFRAVVAKHDAPLSFLFSGALLGAAVLSKYYAAFLLPAFLFWFFLQPNHWRRNLGLVWFFLGGLPFALQHLIWNQSHCWANFIFNFVSRQSVNDGPLYQILILFVLYLLVMSFPYLKLAVQKRSKNTVILDAHSQEWLKNLEQFLRLVWMVPVFIFGLTALSGRGQGFHWLMFLLPFFVMWVGLRLSRVELSKCFDTLTIATGLLSVVMLMVGLSPERTLGYFFQHRFQFEFAQITHKDEWVDALFPDARRADAIFTEGYTFSSVLNFDLQQYALKNGIALPEVSVWGSGSRFGRVFDWTTDFSRLDGKNLMIVTPGPFPETWSHYFTNLKTEARELNGIPYYVSTGTGFKADLYLKEEFRKPVETYYLHSSAKCSIWDSTHS